MNAHAYAHVRTNAHLLTTNAWPSCSYGQTCVRSLACRRDEALAAIQTAIREQQQQELNIQAEITGYKRDIVKQQVQNEQVMAILRKVEGEAGHVAKNIEGARASSLLSRGGGCSIGTKVKG